jgi:hypothetical protein
MLKIYKKPHELGFIAFRNVCPKNATKMGTPPGWELEHRASNPVSVKNLTAIETSTIVKLRTYVPVGTKRTSN